MRRPKAFSAAEPRPFYSAWCPREARSAAPRTEDSSCETSLPLMKTLKDYPTRGALATGMGFRENATKFLTFVARWVGDSVFRTNRSSRGEMWLNGQTHRHTDTATTVTLAAHARRGLNRYIQYLAMHFNAHIWYVSSCPPYKQGSNWCSCCY